MVNEVYHTRTSKTHTVCPPLLLSLKKCAIEDISFGTIMAASLLRAARLVVVYDRDLRRKYQQLVKQSAQRKCMAGALGFCSLAAMVITIRHYYSAM